MVKTLVVFWKKQTKLSFLTMFATRVASRGLLATSKNAGTCALASLLRRRYSVKFMSPV